MENISECVYRSILFDQQFLMYYMNKLIEEQQQQIKKNIEEGFQYEKNNTH